MGLFGFGKKKDMAAEAVPATEVAEFDRDEALAKIAKLEASLDGVEGEEAAKILDEVGRLHVSLNNIDEAIDAYERSLAANTVMGKTSNALVKLYNKKRAAAAAAKDDEGIKYYMDKVNEMLSLSKDQLRGRA